MLSLFLLTLTDKKWVRTATYSLLVLCLIAAPTVVVQANQSAQESALSFYEKSHEQEVFAHVSMRYRSLVNSQKAKEDTSDLLGLSTTIKYYLENERYVEAERLLDLVERPVEIASAEVQSTQAAVPSESTTVHPSPAPTVAPKSVSQPVKTTKPAVVPTVTPTPAPVVRKASTTLTVEGIVYWTNVARKENNLPALTINATLNKAGTDRVNDMFNKQYFAHTTPTGATYVSFAEAAGYMPWYSLAENIASGTVGYLTDEKVVQLWMDSPGHRVNILSPTYTEIGIGVEKGTFEDDNEWVISQLFGTP